MLKINSINYLNNYKIEVQFENNEIKICDITEFLNKGSFVDLKDLDIFKNIKNTGFSIEWSNGLDLSSDTLYCIGH